MLVSPNSAVYVNLTSNDTTDNNWLLLLQIFSVPQIDNETRLETEQPGFTLWSVLKAQNDSLFHLKVFGSGEEAI